MKLYHYGLAAVASLVMLPGCSHEELVADSSEAGEAVYIPGDSEFEIALSYGKGSNVSVSKRSAVNSVADMDAIGVFCLARGKQNINQIVPDIDWFSDVEYPYNSCTLMKNVRAEVSDEDGSLGWEGHYYYPISQFYAYGLYGYYPYVEDENVTYSDGKAVVHYTIDGTQDLIWGRASEHDADASAYSATFFRQSADVADFVPVLDMKHLLTRLEFYVSPGETYAGSGVVFSGAENMVVQSISIVCAYDQVDVVVADLARPNADLAEVVPNTSSTANFSLKNADDTPLTPVAVGTVLGQETRIGESIMLAPGSQYILDIVLRDEATGEVFQTEFPLTLTSPESDVRFQAGTSYKVTIQANKPKEINLKANVNEWPEAENNPPTVIL